MKSLLLLLVCTSVFLTSCGHVTVQRFNQLSMLKKGMSLTDLGEDYRDDDQVLKFEVNQDGTVYTIVPVYVMSSRVSIINFGGGGTGAGAGAGAGATGRTSQREIGGDEFYLVFDANKKLIAGDFLYRLKFSENSLISSLGKSIELAVQGAVY